MCTSFRYRLIIYHNRLLTYLIVQIVGPEDQINKSFDLDGCSWSLFLMSHVWTWARSELSFTISSFASWEEGLQSSHWSWVNGCYSWFHCYVYTRICRDDSTVMQGHDSTCHDSTLITWRMASQYVNGCKNNRRRQFCRGIRNSERNIWLARKAYHQKT